jgi:hypothetical protein
MATVSQLVDEYVAKIDIEDNASRPAEAVASKIDKVSDAAQNAAANARGLTRAMQETGESAKIADPAFERLAQRVDSVTQAERGLTRATEALQAAQSAAAREGAVDADAKERQSRTLAELARRVETWAQKLGEARADADALESANAALNGTLAQGQGVFSQHIASLISQAQASRSNREATELANQAERERAVQVQRLTGALNSYVQANDPLAASLAKVIRAEEELAQLRSLGINATAQQADTVAQMRRAHDDLAGGVNRTTNALGLQRYQVQNVTAQFVDFGVQISSGGGILLPFIQQAPQAVEAVGGLRAAFGLLAQIFTPARIAAGGVTLAIGAMGMAANNQEGALVSMQTRLRAVTADYLAMGVQAEATARQTALAVPGLSLGDARSAQISLAAAAPRGSSFDLKALTAQAADFAAVMGIDVKAGVERFAQAMRDPVALVDELAREGFPGMNEALRLTVQRLVEGGERGDAFALVMSRLRQQTDGAARDSLSPLGKAVDDLKKEFNAFFADVGRGLAGPAQSFAEWLSASLRDLQNLREQQDAFDKRNEETARGGTDDARVWGGAGATGTIPLVPSASNPVNLPDVVRQAITVASARSGVDSDILARIYARGEQSRPNADGSWPVSPKGAEGPFQVMPGTFAELAKRYNISGTANDPQAGALAAAYYWREQYQKFGDVGLAMGAYNAGPGRINDVLAGKAQLPNETAGYIRRTTSGYNGNPLVAGVTPAGPAAASDRVYGPAYPGPVAVQRTGDDSSDLLNRTLRMARGAAEVPGQDGTLATQRAGLQQAIALAEQAKKLAGDNAQAQDVLTAAQEKWRAALEAAKGPHAEFVEEQQRALRTGQQLDPVQRAVTETLERYTDSMQRQGLTPTAGQLEEVRANKLRELQGAYIAATAEVDRQTESQRRIGVAYADGEQAVARAAAAEKAHELVRTSGITSAEARRVAEEGLTQSLLDQQRVNNDNAAMASNLRSKDGLALIQREAELVGMTTEARERELTAMKARQDLESRPGGTSESVIKEAEKLARQTVDATARTNQLKNSWAAIPAFVEDTAGTIKNALVSAIAAGEQKAISFGNVWRAVKASAISSLVELGAINPALNYAFGGSRGTLSGISSVVGGGGGAAAGAGGGTTGLMDGASGVGKLFGGGTGGVKTGFAWLDNTLSSNAYSTGYGNVSVSGAVGGAAGVAGGLYGIYSGVQTGGARGWAQGIGGAASTIAGATSLLGVSSAGAAVGGAAAAVGGAAGASAAGVAGAAGLGVGAGAGAGVLATIGAVAPYVAIAALIASYFLSGQKPSDMTGVYKGNLATGTSSVGGLTGARYSQENRDTASNIGRAVESMSDTLKRATGVAAVPFNFEVAVGTRDGMKGSFEGKEREYGADEAGSKALIDDMTAAMIRALRPVASADVRSVIDRSGGSTETTLANLDWYNSEYKSMIKESEAPTPQFVTEMEAALSPINDAITKARELGLAEEKLTQLRERAAQVLADQRAETLKGISANDAQRQALASGTSPLELQIQNFQATAEAEMASLNQQLASLDIGKGLWSQLTTTRWATMNMERDALVRQQEGQVRQQQIGAASNRNGLLERIQAADGSSATQDGALWAFDRRAHVERTAAAADGVTDMVLLERTLADERLGIMRDFARQQSALEQQRFSTTTSLYERYTAATGDNSADTQLWLFDRRALAERTAAAADGVTDMVLLEQTLAAERLRVQRDYAAEAVAAEKQANDTAASTAASLITSLTGYARQLRYGETSSISAQSQYDLASSSLNAVGGAAVAGDWNSITKVQSYAQDFLNTSRVVNGSGQQYAADMARVLNLLDSVAGLGPDRLTDSARQIQAIDSQTTTLVAELQALRSEVKALRVEQQQQGSAPDRAKAA